MILGVGLGYQPADGAMLSVPQAERVGLVLFIGPVALGREQRHFGAATSGTDRQYKRHFHAPTLEAPSPAPAAGSAHSGLLPSAQRAAAARRSVRSKGSRDAARPLAVLDMRRRMGEGSVSGGRRVSPAFP